MLLFCALIWGTTFVAQRFGMNFLGPLSFQSVRTLLGCLALLPVVLVRRKRQGARFRMPSLRAVLACGLALAAASSLQQIALTRVAAGKAGFITALYVVLVPVAAWLLFRKNPGKVIWLGVALAVAALWLLCMPAEGFSLQGGDLLVLGCAFCFTAQILAVDRHAPRVDCTRLARDEFLVTGALSLVCALLTETITWEGIREAAVPLLYAGVMSGAFGYTLQIFGQRDTDPTVASIIMSLESVFATLTGVIILGEKMTVRETVGCVLMFIAVILSQLSPVISSIRRSARSHR